MSALQTESVVLNQAAARTASASLEAAVRSVESAKAILDDSPSSLRRWRCLSELLVARKAFLNHSAVCTSEGGPLLHLVDQKPRLNAHICRLRSEHDELRRDFDNLIARASRQEGQDLDSSEIGLLGQRLDRPRFTSTGLAFEWANRDIGGEG